MSLKDQSRHQAIHIGEKIRELRCRKGMTQKELSEGTISRNMLSMIESGNALPSLDTLIHIAHTLDIPVGYFFAEGDEIMLYGKRESLNTVYDLMRKGKYSDAADICEAYADTDTEMLSNLAMCRLHHAAKLLSTSMLVSAHNHITEAKKASSRLPFGGDNIIKICDFITMLCDNVSEESIPDVTAETYEQIPAGIIAYLSALRAVKENDPDCASAIARSGMLGKFHSLHIRGAVLMQAGDFDSATRLFDLALSSDDGGFYSRYKLVCDLELCRKNAGDFEAAYALSTSRMEMLGMFSK